MQIVSETVKISTDLQQGYFPFPILFNLVLEKIIRELYMVEGATLTQSDLIIDILPYTDDIALLGNNLVTVKQHCKN